MQVFEPGRWRIDGCRERKSLNHDTIVEDLETNGKQSRFATAVCPFSGINAMHACAINGYLSLLKVFIEKGEMSPLTVATGLSMLLNARLEHVRGADVMWMAKRRGHRHIMDYLKTLPVIKQVLISVEKQLVVIEDAHKKYLEEARAKVIEEARLRAEEEARQAIMERKRKEKEKAQRKMRDDIQAFDNRLRAYKKRLQDQTIAFKLADTGQSRAMEILEDELASHKQESNRCKHMRSVADEHEIGGEMKKTETLIADIECLLKEYVALWSVDAELSKSVAHAHETRWRDLVPEDLEEVAKKMTSKVKKLPKNVKQSEAFKCLDRHAKEFSMSCPLITSLHTPAMKARHWDELRMHTDKLKSSPIENADVELADILALELHQGAMALAVEEITDKAVKEAKQEEILKTLDKNWAGIQWVKTQYDKDPEVPLLKMDEKDFEQLESDLLTLQSMVSSRYDFFKAQSTKWQQELQNVGEVITILAELQRMWSYLEPLFIGSDEVKRELPETAAKFAEIDLVVRKMLKEAAAKQSVKLACNKEGLIPLLEDLTTKQEMAKKSLNEFLDSKRVQFARFYFTSEADLLDILSNGSNPLLIMKHVDKVMLATKNLTLTENAASNGRPLATTWISGVGEEYREFLPPPALLGKVEVYLQTVLEAQQSTLKQEALGSLERYAKQSRVDWLQDTSPDSAGKPNATDAAQIGLLIAAIYYVREYEAAMEKATTAGEDAIQEYYEQTLSQLSDLIQLTKTKLDKAMRTRVMCAITYDAHSRDMIEKALRQMAFEATSFQWQSQLKMRYDKAQDRWIIHILNAEFDYGFEYLGNGPRLVVTPLTDRVYVTATQALNLCMGCAPAGPAGTGASAARWYFILCPMSPVGLTTINL